MKIKNFFKGLVCCTLVAGLCFGAAELGNKVKLYNPLSQDAIVSGIHLSSLRRDELLNIKYDPAEVVTVVTEKNGNQESFIGGDVLSNPLEDKAFQNTVKHKALSLNNDLLTPSFFGKSRVEGELLHFNKKGVDKTIASLPAVSALDVIPTTDAYGQFDISTVSFNPVPESIGTEVDTKLLEDKINSLFNSNVDGSPQVIDLTIDKIYKNPTVVFGSPELETRIQKLNSALNSTITYDYGWRSTSLTGTTFGNWLSSDENGNVVVNRDQFKAYLEDLKEEKNWFTSKEEALQEKEVLTGYLINYDSEIDAATQAIQTDQCLERELQEVDITIDDIATIYTAENQERLNQLQNELGPEFVYINVPQQFMWYYKNNTLLCATPITTGTKNANDTPLGLYDIQYKAMNVTLKGENNDGSKYESPVVYWLPFNGGIGIHDADGWRSYYGSSVYTYNGSHGCVNTPREKCAIIFDNISVGCPVLVE